MIGEIWKSVIISTGVICCGMGDNQQQKLGWNLYNIIWMRKQYRSTRYWIVFSWHNSKLMFLSTNMNFNWHVMRIHSVPRLAGECLSKNELIMQTRSWEKLFLESHNVYLSQFESLSRKFINSFKTIKQGLFNWFFESLNFLTISLIECIKVSVEFSYHLYKEKKRRSWNFSAWRRRIKKQT